MHLKLLFKLELDLLGAHLMHVAGMAAEVPVDSGSKPKPPWFLGYPGSLSTCLHLDSEAAVVAVDL